MGLSSSQARLLNLTARMHQIEYKAAKLEAQKLQMANESRRVYEDYLYALDATKIQAKIINTDGSLNYVDATYNSMKDRGYIIKFASSDRIPISIDTEANYLKADGNRNYFIALQTGHIDENGMAADGVYEIYTADQLMHMESNKNYRLMSNIDLTGKNWTSKILDSGKTFDGNGYSITGLNNAMFSSVHGTVKNLSVQGNTTTTAILAKAAYSGANIENVSVSGSINTTANNVGALVGYVNGSNINISNCSANANITTTSGKCGTLIGFINGTSNVNITNCSASGSVQGYINVGGFVGIASHATISNCASNASVYATKADLSDSHGADECSGGFVGQLTNSTVTNCESRGDVKGEGGVLGGFVGLADSGAVISNSNSYSNVTSNLHNIFSRATNTAGFVSAVAEVTITNCNAYGTVNSGGDEAACSGFVTSDMSGNPDAYTDIIQNCYSSSSLPFAKTPASIDTLTESPTPNFNTINALGASHSQTTNINDDINAGALFDEIQKNGYVLEGTVDSPELGHEDDTEWFTNMVNAGELFIFKTDINTKELYQVSVSTDTGLQEVSDEYLLKKAEAKYEADMKRIDLKDRKYDTDLAALDTERNAIKQEMETLRTIAKENVERTFKLFS